MRLIGLGVVLVALSTSGVLAQDSTETSGETAADAFDAPTADEEGGESLTDVTDLDATDAETGESSEEEASDAVDVAEDESVGGGALQEGVDSGHGCQVAFGATTTPVPPALLGLYVVLAHMRRRRRRRFSRHVHA
jgi:MYXO-CTERM domain-containing protein